MTYIVRYKSRPNQRTRYWTVAPEGLIARYRGLRRDTGKTMMGMRVVEDAGVDRSTVDLRSKSDTSLTEEGLPRGVAYVRVRLLDRHTAIRQVAEDDLTKLAEFDQQIEAKKAELKAIRTARAEAVQEVWKRAQKVSISELEERANA